MKVAVAHEIPFHDVDSLQIAWHGHHYKYFELARTALYRSLQLDIQDMQELGYAFPVIESHCRYCEPLKYGQKIIIHAYFKAWQYYILIHYRIDSPGGRRLAYGHTKQAVCDPQGILQTPVPEPVHNVFNAHEI